MLLMRQEPTGSGTDGALTRNIAGSKPPINPTAKRRRIRNAGAEHEEDHAMSNSRS